MNKLLISIFIFCFCAVNGKSNQADQSHIKQVAGLCKVWGLVKYYHPDVIKGKINWDEVLISNYSMILNDQDFDSFNQHVSNLLDTLNKETNHKITTTVQFNAIVNDRIELLENFNFLTDTSRNYSLVSFSWIDDSIFSKENKIRLCNILVNYKAKKSSHLKGRIRLRHKENTFEDLDSITRPYMLLALFRYWNTINYYFPYKNLSDHNWDSVLIMHIPDFLQAKNYLDYTRAMRKIASKTDDSHSSSRYSSYKFFPPKKINKVEKGWIPYNFRVIDSNVIVSSILVDSSSLSLGDTIIKINRTVLNTQRQALSELKAHSTKQSEANYFERVVSNRYDSAFTFTKVDGNDTLVLQEHHFPSKKVKLESFDRKLPHYYSINANAGYVDLTEISFKSLKKAIKKFNKNTFIIFDIRGYPESIAWLALPHLLSKQKKPVASFNKPNKKYPGTFIQVLKPQHYRFWFIKPFVWLQKKYNGDIVVLIDGQTISQSETIGMMFKAYGKNVTFIGTPTLGANGDISTIHLPGFLSINFSSLDWYFPNGKRLQRIGIIPDRLVQPTIVDILLRKDEIFEAAKEYIK